MPRHARPQFVPALALALSVCLPALATAAPALEITGPGGVRAFSVAQLRKLPATEGFGGVKSSTGKVTLPARYKGVALRALVAAAGGYDATKNAPLFLRAPPYLHKKDASDFWKRVSSRETKGYPRVVTDTDILRLALLLSVGALGEDAQPDMHIRTEEELRLLTRVVRFICENPQSAARVGSL